MKLIHQMPPRINLGQHRETPIEIAIFHLGKAETNSDHYNPTGLRTVMGFNLPPWQRPDVWTPQQKLSFIESAWLGIPIGTYTYNDWEAGSPVDNLLIDGQQRLRAIQEYLAGAFSVFGAYFADLSTRDQRRFEGTKFACYRCETEDEAYLRTYYDLTNFGGTPHEPHQRAVPQAS